MKQSIIASVASLLASNVQASIKMGPCRDPVVKQDFDVAAYMGFWYEQSRDKYTVFETFGKCTNSHYTLNEDGTVRVRNNAHYRLVGWIGNTGVAIVADPEKDEGNLIVTFSKQIPQPDDHVNYQVVDTDYQNWAVVYGAGEIAGGLSCGEQVWILGRLPHIEEQYMEAAKAVIAEQLPGYDFDGYAHYTHQGRFCPYENEPQ